VQGPPAISPCTAANSLADQFDGMVDTHTAQCRQGWNAHLTQALDDLRAE
jgi:hypothetical protein